MNPSQAFALDNPCLSDVEIENQHLHRSVVKGICVTYSLGVLALEEPAEWVINLIAPDDVYFKNLDADIDKLDHIDYHNQRRGLAMREKAVSLLHGVGEGECQIEVIGNSLIVRKGLSAQEAEKCPV